MYQLNFFDHFEPKQIEHVKTDEDARKEVEKLRAEVRMLRNELIEFKAMAKDTKASGDKVRKGLFAKHGELAKMYVTLMNEFEDLKVKLCKFDSLPRS